MNKGYVIAHRNFDGNLSGTYLAANDGTDDWHYGASMREAYVFNHESDARKFADIYDLDINDFQIMQIEYEFNGKVF